MVLRISADIFSEIFLSNSWHKTSPFETGSKSSRISNHKNVFSDIKERRSVLWAKSGKGNSWKVSRICKKLHFSIMLFYKEYH